MTEGETDALSLHQPESSDSSSCPSSSSTDLLQQYQQLINNEELSDVQFDVRGTHSFRQTSSSVTASAPPPPVAPSVKRSLFSKFTSLSIGNGSLDDDSKELTQTFYANRAILALRSKIFKAMLFGKMKESIHLNESIVVPDVTPDAFLNLLEYIYTNCAAKLTKDNVMDTLYAATKYQVDGLVKQCIKWFKSNMTPANAIYLWQSAQRAHMDQLIDECFIFITQNLQKVIQTESWKQLSVKNLKTLVSSDVLNIPEIKLFEACLAWSEAGGGDAEGKSGDYDLKTEILPLIRFPLMSTTDLLGKVQQANVLSMEELVRILTFVNVSKDAEIAFISRKRHRLSSPIGKICLMAADYAGHIEDVKQRVSKEGLAVDVINLETTKLDPKDLKNYSCVLLYTATWGPHGNYDNEQVGDILASYVDEGGHVVICYCNRPPSGKWKSFAYSPLTWSSISQVAAQVEVIMNEENCAFIDQKDPDKICGPMWTNSGTLSFGAEVLLEWPDGRPLFAVKQKSLNPTVKAGTVVFLNVYPPSKQSSGDVVSQASLNGMWDPTEMNCAKIVKQAIVYAHESQCDETVASTEKIEGEVAFLRSADFSFHDGDCSVSLAVNAYRTVRLNFWMKLNSGTHTYKLRLDRVGSYYLGIGVVTKQFRNYNSWQASDGQAWAWYYGTDLWTGGKKVRDYPDEDSQRWKVGDVIEVVVNMNRNVLQYSRNGVFCGTAFTKIGAPLALAVSISAQHDQVTLLSYEAKTSKSIKIVQR